MKLPPIPVARPFRLPAHTERRDLARDVLSALERRDAWARAWKRAAALWYVRSGGWRADAAAIARATVRSEASWSGTTAGLRWRIAELEDRARGLEAELARERGDRMRDVGALLERLARYVRLRAAARRLLDLGVGLEELRRALEEIER